MDIVDTRIRLPGSMVVYGPSGAGKTELVVSILHPERQESVFGERIPHLFYIYSIWQPAYDRLKVQNPEVKFLESFSQVPTNLTDSHIVVFDDMFLKFQTNRKAKREILDVFFRLAHHRNMFVIVMFQALHGHGLRNAVLNAQYQVYFPVKSDMKIFEHVSSQVFPERVRSFLRNAVADSAKEKFGYILLDRSPTQDVNFAVRNFIYPTKNGKFYIHRDESPDSK